MNTRLKTVAGFALVVALSAGLAMAGRGGGGHGGGGGGHGGGGGGFHGGGGFRGGGGGGFSHTPSFSTPHQSFNAPRQSFNTSRQSFNTPAFRTAAPQNFGANRSAIGQRSGIAATPSWDNRLNTGNRPGVNNRPNIGNQANLGNRTNIGNNMAVNRTNNFVRPTHNDWNHGDWHHGDWHGNWNNSWSGQPMGWGMGGYWDGGGYSSIPWSWGYWPYYNPYYTSPGIVGGFSYDYSQPIVVAQAAALPPGTPAGLTAEGQATPLLDAARASFMQGDYQAALVQVDQAIVLVPNDTVVHELRSLVLFALGRYKEAAAADYAVLSTGPGWDWTTLSGLYPNVDVYTAQLRALEQYAKTNPAASDAKFLLAEHYLTCGYTDAAAAQLKEVVRLNPKDQLSAQLLHSISTPDTATPAVPIQPVAPTQPATAASLAGNWTATRADSATIKLALAADGKFTWATDQNGKPQQQSGTYTIADNLLVLKQGDKPMMVGQVASVANNRFNFKLAGDNLSDPGLTFVR